MGSISFAGLTGEGNVALGVNVGVIDAYAEITAFGAQSQVYGSTPPRRTYQIGWIGLGYITGTSTGGPYIGWWAFIDMEARDWERAPGGYLTYADTLFYSLDPGVELSVFIEWP